MAAKSKLTENMTACLKILAAKHPERVWYAAHFPYRSNHSLTALEKRGMVDYVNAVGYGITEAGRDYLAALDSKAAAPAQPAGDFGVGDVVRYVGTEVWLQGATGTVTNTDTPDEYPDCICVDFGASERWCKPEELELWTPAEPGSDAKDEYTRDEEQARLLARIRELEEALEGLNKLVAPYAPFSRPGNSSFEVLARKVYEATNEALAEAQEERG